MRVARVPLSAPSDELSHIDKYVLVDAYLFIKKALFFPSDPPDMTPLEFQYLEAAYLEYNNQATRDVQSPEFERAMREMNNPSLV